MFSTLIYLYVCTHYIAQEQSAALSHLARQATRIDKYTPEAWGT